MSCFFESLLHLEIKQIHFSGCWTEILGVLHESLPSLLPCIEHMGNQVSCMLTAKDIQTLTTSHHLPCCYSGLKRHDLLLGLLQWLTNHSPASTFAHTLGYLLHSHQGELLKSNSDHVTAQKFPYDLPSLFTRVDKVLYDLPSIRPDPQTHSSLTLVLPSLSSSLTLLQPCIGKNNVSPKMSTS